MPGLHAEGAGWQGGVNATARGECASRWATGLRVWRGFRASCSLCSSGRQGTCEPDLRQLPQALLVSGLENRCHPQCAPGKEVNQDLKRGGGGGWKALISTTYTCLTFAPDSFLLSEEWVAPNSLVLPSQRKQLTSAGPPVLCCFIARKFLLV